MRYCLVVLLGLVILHAVSCSYLPQKEQGRQGRKNLPYANPTLIETNYQAGQILGNNLAEKHLAEEPEGPILLASFVNLDNLEESSSLGRIIPQQIGSALSDCGFKLLDVRLRADSMRIEPSQGEFALSRELKVIAREQKAYGVLVGTYSKLYGQIYVNAKILKSSDKITLAATDYLLPYEPGLLDPKGFSGQEEAKKNIQPNVRTKLQ